MVETTRVLVVDDEPAVRDVLKARLARVGYAVDTADGGGAGVAKLREGDFHVALIDLFMPDMDGKAVLAAVAEQRLDTVPLIITGYGNIRSAVEAMKLGAFDFLEKDATSEALHDAVEKAAEHARWKRHARRYEEAAKQWETTFDAVPDLIAIVDDRHRFQRVNKSMAERLGCTAQEAVGRSCFEGVHGLDAPQPACSDKPFPQDGADRLDELYAQKLGGHFRVSTSPLRDAQGRFIGSVYVAHDITTQKQKEEELREAHKEAENLLASMSSFLISVDPELRVIRWNRAAETTFGTPAADVLGRPFVDSGIRWDWDMIARELAGWLHAGQPLRLPEIRYRRADGSDGFLGATINPIRDDDGKSLGFFLLGADITERKHLETQLARAQKLESIGQLAAGIAHEINSPTQYVGDNLEFLQTAFADLAALQAAYQRVVEAAEQDSISEELLADAEAAAEKTSLEFLAKHIPRAIEQSLEGVRRVATIVQAMKEFSHPGAAEKTPVDLNRCIQSTITVARNEWKYVAEMHTDFDPDLPLVPCLPGEFNQAILNMIVNAAHAIADVTGEGAAEKGTITIRTRREGSAAEIRISDTGSGISEDVLDRIFDPFFTTKGVGRGTGQGLAIAHNVIVEKHGGTVTVNTEIGRGATFTIRLPIEGIQEK